MKRKASALIIIFCFAVSTLTAMEFVSLLKADPYIPPEEAPPGYRIYSDGTCDVEILRRDGDVYTLVGDVQGTIVIERDGVVLDGAGYTLHGKGSSYGVWLQDRINVTIKNLRIQNFGHGIRFSHYVAHRFATNPNRATDCTIEACKITNCSSGITLYYCLNCKLLGNYIANNSDGVRFTGSGNIFRNNRIEGSQYNFCDDRYSDNDVDASNTVDGKPIYYWINQHNMTVPDNAGIVILKQCSGIKIQNLKLKSNTYGISLSNTNETTIHGNTISKNIHAIAIYNAHNNSIEGNQITNNQDSGINLYKSNGTRISNNLIESNQYGIYCGYYSVNTFMSSNQIISNSVHGIQCFSNVTVIDNYIYANERNGIWISDISKSVIARNNLTLNADAGIYVVDGTNSTLSYNYISKNKIGVLMGCPSENTIMFNDIVENTEWGIRIEGYATNNLIYLNNFRNNNNSIQASVKPIWIYPGDERYASTSGLPQQVAGYANFWDNCTYGNYWSDYNPETQDSSVSTMSYFIDDNNQDNHPLSTPLNFTALEMPSIKPPQETEPPADSTTKSLSTFPAGVIVCIASVATASIGLIIYFKKRKR